MNIREAILAAADHIERHPEEFDFRRVRLPEGEGCGTPGCALGWIGYFAKCKYNVVEGFGSDKPLSAVGFMGLSCQSELYRRMDRLAPDDWRESAVSCAIGLRAYADLYHASAANFARDLAARLASQPAITEDAPC